jgi:hypothetical protein
MIKKKGEKKQKKKKKTERTNKKKHCEIAANAVLPDNFWSVGVRV